MGEPPIPGPISPSDANRFVTKCTTHKKLVPRCRSCGIDLCQLFRTPCPRGRYEHPLKSSMNLRMRLFWNSKTQSVTDFVPGKSQGMTATDHKPSTPPQNVLGASTRAIPLPIHNNDNQPVIHHSHCAPCDIMSIFVRLIASNLQKKITCRRSASVGPSNAPH